MESLQCGEPFEFLTNHWSGRLLSSQACGHPWLEVQPQEDQSQGHFGRKCAKGMRDNSSPGRSNGLETSE